MHTVVLFVRIKDPEIKVTHQFKIIEVITRHRVVEVSLVTEVSVTIVEVRHIEHVSVNEGDMVVLGTEVLDIVVLGSIWLR